jgi:GTPase SAR1 family protein
VIHPRIPARTGPRPSHGGITCPYCFTVIPRREVRFRCQGGAPGRGSGCQPQVDQVLADYLGSTVAATLPPVFSGDGRRQRANCPRCGQETFRRVCPECHNQLPAQYCETPGRIVALVGAKNAGKSTYIAVLLHELEHRLGSELRTSLVACDDRTIDRYQQDFARPLFGEHRLLPTTQSAATEIRWPMVFLLSRTREGRFRRHDTSLALVLFDTAGEDLGRRDLVDLHLRYLTAADAIIFLVDPLELPGASADTRVEARAATGPDGDTNPLHVLGRVTETLRSGHELRPGQRLKVPLAVGLTKIDVLQPSLASQSPLHRPRPRSARLDLDDREAVHEQIRALLHSWHADGLDHYLQHNYAEYGFFGLSALGGLPRDGVVAPGGIRPYRVEDPLLWLLHRYGMLDAGHSTPGPRPNGGAR